MFKLGSLLIMTLAIFVLVSTVSAQSWSELAKVEYKNWPVEKQQEFTSSMSMFVFGTDSYTPQYGQHVVLTAGPVRRVVAAQPVRSVGRAIAERKPVRSVLRGVGSRVFRGRFGGC